MVAVQENKAYDHSQSNPVRAEDNNMMQLDLTNQSCSHGQLMDHLTQVLTLWWMLCICHVVKQSRAATGAAAGAGGREGGKEGASGEEEGKKALLDSFLEGPVEALAVLCDGLCGQCKASLNPG